MVTLREAQRIGRGANPCDPCTVTVTGWAGHESREWHNADMMNSFLRDTKAAMRRASIETSNPFTLTCFRKSFAQNYANVGTPPKTLAKLLGHGNTRVTLEFYNQTTDAKVREAAQRMDRILGHCGLRRVQDGG